MSGSIAPPPSDREAVIVEVAQHDPVRVAPAITETRLDDGPDRARLGPAQGSGSGRARRRIAHGFEVTNEQGQITIAQIDGDLPGNPG